MLFTFYGLIIFMKEIWIGVKLENIGKDKLVTRLGFSVPAILTRHTITCKPMDESKMLDRPSKHNAAVYWHYG